MMAKKLNLGAIPAEVLEFALAELKKIRSGEVSFVAQDGYLMQVEINQRRRLVVKIQKGRVVQIERTVQHRFTGLDGEGI